MKENVITCDCQSECKTKRCACLKAGHACGDKCGCLNCKNPFNAVGNSEQLTDCARDHIKKVVSLSEKALNRKYKLPCECNSVALKDLLSNYSCPECGEIFYYSFCIGEVAYGDNMWHCCACGICREDSEWHCKRCNECTYGITLACEGCGKKSPYMS